MKTGRKPNTISTFFQRIKKTDSCWLWEGTKNNAGRGMFKLDGKYLSVSRLSHSVHIGPIPEGMCVCHKCDNPMCVNPDHLFLGTHQDNVADRVIKGRSAVGASNFNTKLTPQQVVEIRSTDFSVKGTKAGMARQLGISHTALNYIVQGKNWGHV